MEIAILVACIIVYIIVGIIITINEPKSVVLKVIFAPAELVFLCLGGLGLFIGWLTKKVRMLIDSDYAEKTRLENKQNQIKQQLNDNYSDIGYTIRRETEEEERKKEQAEIELKEKREKEEIEKRISFFENSEATKKIVEYIRTKSNGVPYIIKINNHKFLHEGTTTIEFYFEGGWDEYNFSKHQLKSIKMPDDAKVFQVRTSSKEISDYFFSKWSKKNDAYYFAVAMNRHFNNAFQLKEDYYGDYGDYDWDYGWGKDIIAHTETTKTCRVGRISVEMTREMRSF